MPEELPPNMPKCCKLLYRYAKNTMKETQMSITTKLDRRCFGVKKDLIVLRENVLELLELNWIEIGVLEAYMVYLHGVVCAKQEQDLFAFVDSGATAVCTRPSFIPYLVNRLRAGGSDHLFMMPYNPGHHWILTVIWEGQIYIIDSMSRPRPYKDWEKVVQSAVKQYQDETGKGNSKLTRVTHLNGAPAQPGGYECGYYVMRYMRDIVHDETLSFVDKWAASRNHPSYSPAEID